MRAALLLTTMIVVPVVALAACPGTGSTRGAFATVNGQIIGPDGNPFIAHGVNIYESDMADAARNLTSTFPGINFVRLAVYNYNDPSYYKAFIDQMTAQGIVVELEDHSSSDGQNRGGGTGTIFTGQRLTDELNWYSSVASAYKNNPYVWFGTDNEPPEPSPAALSTWQQQTYNAVRNAGNNNPVMLEINGWADPASFGAGLTPSVYAAMHNVIADPHWYGWLTNYGGDATSIGKAIAASIAQTQTIQTADGKIPVIIGEFGDSTVGDAVDPNGSASVAAVLASGYGSAAWNWAAGGQADRLRNSDGSLTPFGQQVAAAIRAGSTGACNPLPPVPPEPAPPPVLPITEVPDAPPLDKNLIAPLPTVHVPPPPVLPQAPAPELLAPPPPEITAPPIPTGPGLPVIVPPPINTQYGLLPRATLPDIPAAPPGVDPVVPYVAGQLKTIIEDIGMISPIGSFLVAMDDSILNAANTALQGMAPMLTIPVTAVALLFMAARGVRINQGDGGAWGAIWFDLVKIVMIFWVSLNLANYDTWVLNMIYTAIPNQLTGAVVAGAGIGSGVHATAAAFDAIYGQTWQVVSTVWMGAGALDFGTKISAELCGLAVAFALMAMALVYLLARILLAVVLVFGPVCIALSMHRQTAPIFERWAGKCFALICLQVAGVIVLVMVMTANNQFMAQINPIAVGAAGGGAGWTGTDGAPAPTVASDLQALTAMVTWFGMGAFALYSLPAIAYSIGTGIATSVVPILAAMNAAGNAIGGAISALVGGSFGGFGWGGGGGGGGPLSLELAREEIEGSFGAALPPPAPPALSSATPPMLGAP